MLPLDSATLYATCTRATHQTIPFLSNHFDSSPAPYGCHLESMPAPRCPIYSRAHTSSPSCQGQAMPVSEIVVRTYSTGTDPVSPVHQPTMPGSDVQPFLRSPPASTSVFHLSQHLPAGASRVHSIRSD